MMLWKVLDWHHVSAIENLMMTSPIPFSLILPMFVCNCVGGMMFKVPEPVMIVDGIMYSSVTILILLLITTLLTSITMLSFGMMMLPRNIAFLWSFCLNTLLMTLGLRYDLQSASRLKA